MKKILFVINVDWFFLSHRLPLALEAQRRGYNVSIACAITDKKEYLEKLGFTVYPLTLSRSGISIRHELNTFIEIYQILKTLRPTVVHFVTIKPVLYGGIASRFLSLSKKVFSISGLGFIFIRQGLKATLIRTLIKMFYKFALGGKDSHVIVQNPDDERVVKSIQKVPITLTKGSGVDLKQYTYKPEIDKHLKVVMACRLLKDKGVFEYANAAKILKNKGLNIDFELYGDIDLHNPASLSNADLETLIQESPITLHGFNDDISSVFANANIVVLPSYREGLPKVLIEAAACGRSVVTTDVPGCRDAILPNVTGLLCRLKNAESLAEHIEELVQNHEKRQSMGKAGRELAEKEFDIHTVIQKHFEIYEEGL